MSFDFHKYLRIFLRKKWFLIVPLVCCSVGFFLSGFVLPKIYQAQAMILVDDKTVVNPLLNNLAVTTPVGYRLQVIKEEILSWPRLFQLVERLGLNKDTSNDALRMEKLIMDIRKNIVLQMRQNGIIMIGYMGEHAKKTQEVVNTLCDLLIQQNVSSQLQDTGSAIDFINEQLKIYKEKLDKAGAELTKFNEIYGLQINLSGSGDSKGENSDIHAPLSQLNQELASTEAELVMAQVELTDEHPRIKSLKRRIDSLKEKRTVYVKEMAKQAGVDSKTYVSIADSAPRQQEELMRLQRDKAINEKIYGMLLDRLESAKITERLGDSDNRTKFQVIEPARLPLTPIKPNKVKLTLLGIILGAAIGAGLIFGLEYLDSSVKTEEDLKELLNVPVLGSISTIMTKEDLANRPSFFEKIFALVPRKEA